MILTRLPSAIASVILCSSLLLPGAAWGQQADVAPPAPPAAAPHAPARDTGCCGPVTPAGERLRALLDGMDVDHLWQSHVKVDWETGEPRGGSGSTHCSAFAAAVGERLNIYMLRPPQHPQDLLASAQGRWFQTEAARHEGWFQLNSPAQAQMLANLGNLVVLVYINPDPHVPGHIAIVRPAEKSIQALEREGPQTTQAGAHNFSSGTAVFSFSKHPGAWPNHVLIYAHMVNSTPGS
jgi:hypothetical protein